MTAGGVDDLLEMIALEQIEVDLFRANFTKAEDHALYGGLVAAQSLAAAGATVSPDRLPHSLHGYFLRRGDSQRATLFRVERDRDGGSFSARRVIAVQQGEVIFNMAASFHVEQPGPELQAVTMPEVAAPGDLPSHLFTRQPVFEARAAFTPPGTEWPTRFWARCRHQLPPDVLTQACVVTYLSDVSSGLATLLEGRGRAASIDHALWFHRPTRLDDWVLVDLAGQVAVGARGHYTGSIVAADGTLVASIAQEMLFRRRGARPELG